jgi:hypothetical protein
MTTCGRDGLAFNSRPQPTRYGRSRQNTLSVAAAAARYHIIFLLLLLLFFFFFFF